jgi:iron complex outermembrane receptor protein
VTTYGGNLLLGSTIQLGRGWALDSTFSHNRIYTEDKGVNGYAITSTLISDIQNGTYNPFGTGDKGSLENARYVPSEITTSQITGAEAKISGEIGQLPGGPVGMAAGIQAAYQKYEDRYDDQSVAGLVFGNAGSSGGGDRSSEAVYTEFGLPAFKSLEFQIAGRYDHYNDFGSTVNPKLAALYHASKDLLFRASWGTGFKAPLMQDLHAATSDGNPTFIDHVACAAEQAGGGDTSSCKPAQYEVQSSGNPGLKQETSVSWNAGTVYQATRDLSFGLDWFYTHTKNVVSIDYGDMTQAELNGVDLSQYNVTVPRDATNHINGAIIAPEQNLSSQGVSGLDFSVGYTLGRFRLNTDHSQLFFFKQEGFPGAGESDKLGKYSGDSHHPYYPRWRNTTTLSYRPLDRHSVNLTATTISGHEKAVPDGEGISHYTSLDLQYVYTLKKSEFSFGILNVLNTTPPLDDTNPKPLDVTLYDQIGRQFLAAYKVRF